MYRNKHDDYVIPPVLFFYGVAGKDAAALLEWLKRRVKLENIS